jgi:hypothetical protein
MHKIQIFPTALLIVGLCGSLYASDPSYRDQSVHSSATNITKPKTAPAATLRQEQVRKDIDQLIAFSKKASLDIRREIKRIRAKKNARSGDAEIKYALGIAEKLERYAGLLQRKKKLLNDNNRENDRSVKRSVEEMSQMDMLKLQDKMQEQEQLMQLMRHIQKQMHESARSIISNLK